MYAMLGGPELCCGGDGERAGRAWAGGGAVSRRVGLGSLVGWAAGLGWPGGGLGWLAVVGWVCLRLPRCAAEPGGSAISAVLCDCRGRQFETGLSCLHKEKAGGRKRRSGIDGESFIEELVGSASKVPRGRGTEELSRGVAEMNEWI